MEFLGDLDRDVGTRSGPLSFVPERFLSCSPVIQLICGLNEDFFLGKSTAGHFLWRDLFIVGGDQIRR